MSTLLAHRYELLEPLSQGGFGQTYLARDRHLPGQPICVVKQLLLPSQDPDHQRDALRLFDQEAHILYQLGNHPQIPRLLAHFESEGQAYLVQDYIEGHTLDAELGKPWAEPAVRMLLRDSLTVLAFVHQQGVIHRDVKPSNLMRRREDGVILLIDFGAVKTIAPQSAPTIAIGTPGYMPLEQLSGYPQPASDLYALGVIALYALTGQRPEQWPTPDPLDRVRSLSLSSDLAALLTRCLHRNWRDRYPDAAAALATFTPHAAAANLPTQPAPALAPTTLTPKAPAPAKSSDRHRQILLNKVRNAWVKGVLERSLHGRVMLELGLSDRSDVLERPWGVVWQAGEQEQPLTAGETVGRRFQQLGAGRSLLILGEPGSGKTTTLLELARDLIHQAEQDAQALIPVVFNLSSWRGQGKREAQPLAAWIVQELQQQYQVAPLIGQDWVEGQQLLLLLDGLDEVRSQWRSPCVEAINQFLTDYGQTELVICSRIADYLALTSRLRLQAAVRIQPLNLDQIQQYLSSHGSGLTAIRTALDHDAALQELARSPLMLSIITLAYRDLPAEQLTYTDAQSLRTHLFNTYIDRMLQRDRDRTYSPHRLRRSLRRLAQQLQRDSQTIFLIEQMQPTWCDTPRLRRCYALGVGFIGSLIAGVVAGVNLGILINPIAGLKAGLILGIGGGLVLGITFGAQFPPIEPVEMIRWSSRKARANLWPGLRIGSLVMIISILAYVLFGWTLGWTRTVTETLLYGLCGFGTGIIFILLQGLTGGSIPTSVVPNQGIQRSLRYTAFFSLIGVSTLSILAGMIGLPLTVGMLVGFIFGCASPPGVACIQHFTLRILLYFDGSLPWNLAQFLNTATRLILLQNVGGGYIFIHRLLLEHFATLPD
ncbi:protein kinase [Spirulina major CS-329]|uniref:protein kinase domain-containing protein n=1 Tax=Spirulina TaxID=1154 RepID=UPI00232AA92D|nr:MULTISPECIES: protein kinase [Spirulina]MDB9496576.1 protein kinase [Spirulina subsalsa CS-330]MDB9503018.1 protein kinase [Spirulina major CS-329]